MTLTQAEALRAIKWTAQYFGTELSPSEANKMLHDYLLATRRMAPASLVSGSSKNKNQENVFYPWRTEKTTDYENEITNWFH